MRAAARRCFQLRGSNLGQADISLEEWAHASSGAALSVTVTRNSESNCQRGLTLHLAGQSRNGGHEARQQAGPPGQGPEHRPSVSESEAAGPAVCRFTSNGEKGMAQRVCSVFQPLLKRLDVTQEQQRLRRRASRWGPMAGRWGPMAEVSARGRDNVCDRRRKLLRKSVSWEQVKGNTSSYCRELHWRDSRPELFTNSGRGNKESSPMKWRERLDRIFAAHPPTAGKKVESQEGSVPDKR